MRPLQVGVNGVLDIAVTAYGHKMPVAECARCGLPGPIRKRGLCGGCESVTKRDGTYAEYGYVKADRLADYAEMTRLLRGGDLNRTEAMRQACARLGISERTGERYERDLKLARLQAVNGEDCAADNSKTARVVTPGVAAPTDNPAPTPRGDTWSTTLVDSLAELDASGPVGQSAIRVPRPRPDSGGAQRVAVIASYSGRCA